MHFIAVNHKQYPLEKFDNNKLDGHKYGGAAEFKEDIP